MGKTEVFQLTVRKCAQHGPECYMVTSAPDECKFSVEMVQQNHPAQRLVLKNGVRYLVIGAALHGRAVYRLSAPEITGFRKEPTAWFQGRRIA